MRLLDLLYIKNLVSGLKSVFFRSRDNPHEFIKIESVADKKLHLDKNLAGESELDFADFINQLKNNQIHAATYAETQEFLARVSKGKIQYADFSRMKKKRLILHNRHVRESIEKAGDIIMKFRR